MGGVFLRYPDGGQEVALQADNLPRLTDDDRMLAAAITLESILGEAALLDKDTEYDVVDQLEPRFAAMRLPVQRLRERILGP
jgi:hypothetical protein